MHEDMTVLMSLALDGQATPAEEARLQAHLAACSLCVATWEDWKAADRLLARAPSVAPSTDLLAGLAVRLEAYDARRQRTRWIGISVLGAGMVMVFLTFSSLGLYLGWSRQPAIVDALLLVLTRLSTGVMWTMRGAATLARSAGWENMALGAGFYLTFAGGLIVIWLWLLARSRTGSAKGLSAR